MWAVANMTSYKPMGTAMPDLYPKIVDSEMASYVEISSQELIKPHHYDKTINFIIL